MFETLRAPLKVGHFLAVALAVTIAVTLYCLAYTALAGGSESVAEAMTWTVINLFPWFAAVEIGKRSRRLGAKLLVLAGALGASLLLGTIAGDSGPVGFELVRRIPGALIAALLLAAANLPVKGRRGSAMAEPIELPLPPEHIDWISAAGNYVELHGGGRIVLHRASLSLVEVQLSRWDFVRVHRSTLVRRDSIARVRPLDVILRDGTILRMGKRYRALLGRPNFVPSSHRAGDGGADTA